MVTNILNQLIETYLFALQRRNRVTEGSETILYVVTSFSFQRIMMSPFFSLKQTICFSKYLTNWIIDMKGFQKRLEISSLFYSEIIKVIF